MPDPGPPPAHRTFAVTRTTGLVVAVGLAAAIVGAVAWYASRASSHKADARPQGEIPPDIMTLPSGSGPGGTGVGKGLRIELADKNDPTRRSALITSETVEPLEARRYAVGKPAAWVFLADGRTLYVRANSGRFSMPSRDQAPERGEFEGDVVAKVFSRAVGIPKDPETAGAESELRNERMDFDMTLPSATVPGRFAARLGGMTLTGESARVIFDQLRSDVQLLQVASNPTLVDEGSPPQSRPQAVTAAPSGPGAPAPGNETLYRAVFAGPVDGSWDGRRLEGSTLEVFARVIDNKLKPGAIAKLPEMRGDKPAGAAEGAVAAGAPKRGTRILHSEGPLELRPLPKPGEELAKNDVFVRIKGNESGPASIVDPVGGAVARGPVVEYGATTLDAYVTGEAPGSVVIRTEKDGEMRGKWGHVNLAARIGQVRGPTTLTDARKLEGGTPRRSLSLSDQGDFIFSRDPKARGWQLAEAIFAGDVNAREKASVIDGDLLHAMFDLDDRGRSRITRATLDGKAQADDGTGGTLEGGSFDLRFAPDSHGKAQPVTLAGKSAEGRKIKGGRAGESLAAVDSLSAELGPDEQGKTAVRTITATSKTAVEYTGKDGTSARTPELRADAVAKVVDLIGPSSTVTQGPSTIVGEVLRLTDNPRTIEVKSGGRFTQVPPAGQEDKIASVDARWSRSMTYSDKTGVLEATGDAHADVREGPLSHDKTDAEFIRIELAPAVAAADKPPAKPADVKPAGGLGDRQILRAIAKGVPGDAERPARVESRRYLPGAEPRKLEQLYYIEGGEINADNQAGTLNVPVAGKVLVLDRRESAEPPPGSNPLASGSTKGSTLLAWKGSMDFTRSTGLFETLGGASLTQQRLADGSVIQVEGERLAATVRGLEGASVKPGDLRGELVKASAVGAVFVRVTGKDKDGKAQERQFVADEMVYDVAGGYLHAQAAEGNQVTVFDTATSTPIKAAAVRWDIAKDRVDIVSPMPIVTPR